jgi:hypothetical protein
MRLNLQSVVCRMIDRLHACCHYIFMNVRFDLEVAERNRDAVKFIRVCSDI